MKVKPQTFYCSSSDWHMARAYSDMPIANTDEIRGNHNWYIPPLVIFIGSVLGSMLHMHWIWVAGIVGSLPLFLICYQKRFASFYDRLLKHYQFAPAANQIALLSIDEQQLSCHFYRPDGSQSHRILLSGIDSIAFTTHSFNLNKLRLPFLLNNKAKQLGAETIPEIWTDQGRYVFAIYVKTKVLTRYSFSIPAQWLKDDSLARFIQTLEQNMGKQLELSPSNPNDATLLRYLQQYTSLLR